MQAYLGDRVPYEKRGLPLALTELSWSLSFIIGVPLTGFLISKYGLTSPFPWLAGLGLLALIPPIPPAACRPTSCQAWRQSTGELWYRANLTFGAGCPGNGRRFHHR